jgi:hypothetical protein
VLELKVTDISFAAVDPADVEITPPPGTKVVDLAPRSNSSGSSDEQPVTGVAAVRAAVPFTLVAPTSVGGRALTSVRLVGTAALLTYGEGLGALVVHESAAADGETGGLLAPMPKVSLGSVSAHELATPLGTALAFERGGVSFVVGGSMTASDAEAAAKALG